jgi:phosphatidylinositol alpha-1,6-mannosyltransferase
LSKNLQHIILVTSEFPPQPGGIGNHAYNLAHQLALNGFQVSVIADQRSLNGSDEQIFDATLNFSVYRVKLKRIRSLMYYKRLYKLMALAGKANIVIASGKFSLWNAGLCSLLRAKKYIAIIHGTEVNFKNSYLRKSIEVSLERFDVIIAVSNYTKSLIKHLNLPVEVIPNGYDTRKWSDSIVPLKNIKGSPKLITIGNVTSRKGQMNVIAHLPVLKVKYPDIHYHCIGLPTEAHNFLLKAKELQIENHVTFHGRLDDKEMQSILMASDIFVMLSEETTTGDVEGFGIAVIEANALGIPAIGSSDSGLEDAIKNEITGFIVASNEPEAFLEAVEKILENKEFFKHAAKAWAKKHEWQEVIKSYLHILRK